MDAVARVRRRSAFGDFFKLHCSLWRRYSIKPTSHTGSRAFDRIGADVVSTTASVLESRHRSEAMLEAAIR